MSRHRLRGAAATTLASLIALPALAQSPAAAPAPADAAPAAAKADLPTFDEIHARNVEAMGGAEKLEAIEDMTITGFMEMPAMGLKGTMKAYHRKPNQMTSTITLPGLGEIRSGTNGDVGWSIDPMRGPALTEPKELAQQQAMERLSAARMNPRDAFPEIEVLSVQAFGGRPCYEVSFKGPELSLVGFYDVETALIGGMRMTMSSPMGEIPMEIVVSDYKTFGEILQPTRTTVNVMGQQQVLGIEDITFGEIDAAVFEMPDAIKGLVAAKQKAAEEAAKQGDAAPEAKEGGTATDDKPARRPRPRPRPKTDAPATAPTP
ncbi:MAG: hypothetical protein ACO3Y3_04845 [Phycisphaerales bacterium]|jgi:hypothetical protein